MTRLFNIKAALLLVTTLALMAAFAPSVSTRFEPTVRPPVTTRGPSYLGIDTRWESQLTELQRQQETRMLALIMLQVTEPVRITGEIPLWSVLTFVGLGIAAFAALKQGLTSHEELDRTRMEGVGSQIEALRDEMHEAIRTLMNQK